MPYFISNSNPNCAGWAVEKEDGEAIGCHTTKQGAIDQMVAVSIAEGMEPGGERNANGKPAIIVDIDGTLIIGGRANQKLINYLDTFDDTEIIVVTARLVSERDTTLNELDTLGIDYDRLIMKPNESISSPDYKEETAKLLLETYNVMLAIDNDPDNRARFKKLGITALDVDEIPDTPQDGDFDNDPEDDLDNDVRQVDLTPPAYMRASARRGLEWYAEGLGGDGLVDRTIREAREMAAGRVSADKWVRIQAWIARHLVDLDSPDANPNSENYPSPGVVAMALWGGGVTKRSAERARAYAEGVVARLEAEEERGKMKHETRNFEADFELREEGEELRFVGYAAKFNSPSEDLGGFIETIEPGAFRRSLRSRNDVKLLINHDMGRVVASTRGGTMKLYEDEIGLRVEASLAPTTEGKDLAILLRRGDLSKMSFGFSVQKDAWNNEMTQRTLKSVRLYEVSVVSMPAYGQTEAMMRSLDKAATRANVDADELADAVLKLEEGADLTDSQAELIKTVVNSLTPGQVKSEEPTEEEVNLLELKRKQLDLLLKRN